MFKILCLDGGGSRGYFTAEMIKNIESKYDIKVNEYFDLIVGTSTGALIAGGIGLDIDINEIIDIYLKENNKIFKTSYFKGIFSSKYDINLLKDLIIKKYNNKNFEDVKCKLLITTTNINDNLPITIESWNNYDNISLVDAVVASAAAPIYFKPYKINENYYCDGCIWANNPSLVALSYALDKNIFKQKIKNIKILSIGTGVDDISQEFGDKKWGLIDWSKNISTLIMKTNVLSNENICKKILGKNFLRINFISNDRMSISEIPKELLDNTDKIFDAFSDRLDKFFKDRKENIFSKIFRKVFRF